jgi:hypothetical protein
MRAAMRVGQLDPELRHVTVRCKPEANHDFFNLCLMADRRLKLFSRILDSTV